MAQVDGGAISISDLIVFLDVFRMFLDWRIESWVEIYYREFKECAKLEMLEKTKKSYKNIKNGESWRSTACLWCAYDTKNLITSP